MSAVQKVNRENLDAVLDLLFQFDNEQMSPAVWRLLKAYSGVEGLPLGYALFEGERAVGFLGTLFSRRTIGDRDENIVNLTAWIVEPEHRHRSLELLFPVLGLKDQTIIDLTASPDAGLILQRLGFKVLETRLLLSDKGGRDGHVESEFQPEILGPEGVKRFADHQGLRCAQAVLRDGKRLCHVVYALNPLRLPSDLKSLRLAWALREDGTVLTAHVHYASEPELFSDLQGTWTDFLWRRHGVALSAIDERMIPPARRDGFRSYELPVPRFFRSKTVSPERIDHLYTELTLFGVSGQGSVVEGKGSSLKSLLDEQGRRRERIAEQARQIDALDAEIIELNLRKTNGCVP